MEISTLNKNMIGKIDLNYYLRIKTSIRVTSSNIKQKLSQLLKGIEYKYIIYIIEDVATEYHFIYHVLINSDQNDMTDLIFKNTSGKGHTKNQKTKMLIRKKLISNTGEVQYVEMWKEIDGVNFAGKNNEVRIEQIKYDESINYVRKYMNENSIIGFITPKIFK